MLQGRFFDQDEENRGAAVCVLGAAARSSLFGAADPIDQYVKVNEQWFRVIGVASPQLSSRTEVAGIPTQDLNNIIYVPLNAAILRLEDSYSDVRDEIDGIYLNLREGADMPAAAQVVRAILDSSHHAAGDFSVIVPAELLAEQRRTERLFSIVMVAIASISLLVGGIGIMNIMLASILERTREIGVRRAVGARQSDIVRQFVVEAMMISFVGGSLGIVFGFVMSRLIALARRMVDHRDGEFHPFGVCGFHHRGPGVRDLSRGEGRAPGSGGSHSLRVNPQYPEPIISAA